MQGRPLGDDPADMGRSREIDTPHLGGIDQGVHNLWPVLCCVRYKVDHAFRKTGSGKGLRDQAVRARATFRSLQNDRITAGQRHSDGAHAQNDRRIPGCHADNYAHGLAHGHGETAGLVGRDDLALDLCRNRCGFSDGRGCQPNVGLGKFSGCANFGAHCLDECLASILDLSGGLGQQCPASIRAGPFPRLKRLGRVLAYRRYVWRTHCDRLRGDGTSQRVYPVEEHGSILSRLSLCRIVIFTLVNRNRAPKQKGISGGGHFARLNHQDARLTAEVTGRAGGGPSMGHWHRASA